MDKSLDAGGGRIGPNGIMVWIEQQFAGRGDPQIDECRLKAFRHRPCNLEHQIAPVVRVLRMPEPDVRYGHAACKAHLAVNDDCAAMRPAMESRQLAELRGTKLVDFTAGGNEGLEILIRDFDTAEAVEEHAHCHALALLLFECLQ